MKMQYPLTTLIQRALVMTSLGAVVLGWFWSIHPWLMGKKQSDVFPTGISWLTSEADCLQTGRVWRDDMCWDGEHDTTF